MGLTSAITGSIGGLCAVFGIATAAELVPPLMEQFTWMFWFVLAAIFLLASIAFGQGRRLD